MEIEQEVPSDPEDPRELHPGALLHRSSRLHNLPLMAEALAHGADVHAAAEEEEGKTPLIQAVNGVSVKIKAVSAKFSGGEALYCNTRIKNRSHYRLVICNYHVVTKYN